MSNLISNFMALQPKKTKHRKMFKGRSKGVSTKGSRISFGSFALKSMGTKWITGAQIEAGRRAVTRTLKRKGKLWIRIFPDKPITKKPPEVGMGKGKGDPDHFVAEVKPGRVLFELDGVTLEAAKEAFRRASSKLSVKTKFVSRER